MNDNLDLFTTEHSELTQLLDRLDTIPPEEIRDKWPRFLVDLVDVLAHELARLDVSEAQLVAMKLAICISNYFGGRAVYLPTGRCFGRLCGIMRFTRIGRGTSTN